MYCPDQWILRNGKLHTIFSISFDRNQNVKWFCRKKLLTTTQYIYQALYKEELNSDITVLALGKTWRLHKVYLCQSSYFASMFGGSWRETNQDFVNIEIIDPKINISGRWFFRHFGYLKSVFWFWNVFLIAMETVFGSLYLDEVTIDPKDVISVLATATLFQLDELINRCSEVMIETVNAEVTMTLQFLNHFDMIKKFPIF